ncbi:hypothetical protein [Dechloromonas sp. ZS-1]
MGSSLENDVGDLADWVRPEKLDGRGMRVSYGRQGRQRSSMFQKSKAVI